MNPQQKGAKDAAGWLPVQNRCWFAARIVDVRWKHDLTIGAREAEVLEPLLANCASTESGGADCTVASGAESGADTFLRGFHLFLSRDEDRRPSK